MNLTLNAHIGHRINVEEPIYRIHEVIGINISDRFDKPQVTTSELVLGEGSLHRDPARLYCRDCDLFLTGDWEYAS